MRMLTNFHLSSSIIKVVKKDEIGKARSTNEIRKVGGKY
jgi:hypothetical protein